MKAKLLHYAFFLLIVALILQAPFKVYNSEKGGWDHEIYCRAAKVLEDGKDPYKTANLGMDLSYPYPAIFLTAYKHICLASPKSYIVFHFIALLSAAVLLIGILKWQPTITMAFLFLGYNAASSNYQTGNIGAFEALFFALFLVSFVRGSTGSVMWLLPSSFLKLVPSLLFIPAFFAKWGSYGKKVQVLMKFGFGLVFLSLCNFFFSGELFWSFWRQAMGRYEGQHSPIQELDANPSNPTVIIFFQNLGQKIGGEYWWVVFGLCLAALIYFSYWVWIKVISREQDRLRKLCWEYLLLFLWMPRLKPYSLVIVSMVMIPLLEKLGSRFAFFVLLLTVFHRALNGDKADPWLDFLANNTAIYTYFVVLILMVLRYERLEKDATQQV